MPRPQCVSCKFFDRFERNPDYGLCRRYAPRPAWISNPDAECAFPWVRNSDWCGEYETSDDFLGVSRDEEGSDLPPRDA